MADLARRSSPGRRCPQRPELGAEVDDAAVALLSHEDGGGLDRREVALEVDGEDLVPLLLAHVEDHAVAQDAGVVDEDVDAAELVDARS